MTYELTAQKVAEHQFYSWGIPLGTNLPEHIETDMVQTGWDEQRGPFVKVYLCEAAAEDDLGVIFNFRDRAGFRKAYRLAREMRPGGRLNGGGAA